MNERSMAEETHSFDGPMRGLIVVCTVTATIMQALDTTIANVALPYMQGSLAASQEQINWVLTSYIVASAIMTPPIGWLSNRFGRRNVFIVAIVGFTVASMMCGLARSLDQIVLFRLLQGVFGAGLVPLSQAIMLDIFPVEKQGPAMAMWGMGVMLGPILGPTLGGWLTENYDWRFVFFINLPVGVLATVVALIALPKAKTNPAARLDWLGFGLLSIAIGAMQMMFDRGQQQDWFSSSEIVIECALAVLCFYMFVAHSLTAEKPFINLALFRDRNLVSGLIFMFALGLVLLATLALLTPYLQQLMGYPVLTAGLVLGPRGLGTMVAMMMVGQLVRRIDPRLLICLGLGLGAVALWEMSGMTTNVSEWWLIRTGFIQGFGFGFIFVPMQTVAFATLPGRLRTDGAALLSLTRNIGSSVGISIVIFMLTRNMTVMHANLAALVNPFRPAISAFHGSPFDPAHPLGATIINQLVDQQAAIIAYADDFWMMFWVTLAIVPLVLLMKRPASSRQGRGGMAHAAME
jgi:DHA2 family multidrug resistance protein